MDPVEDPRADSKRYVPPHGSWRNHASGLGRYSRRAREPAGCRPECYRSSGELFLFAAATFTATAVVVIAVVVIAVVVAVITMAVHQ